MQRSSSKREFGCLVIIPSRPKQLVFDAELHAMVKERMMAVSLVVESVSRGN